MNPELPSGGVVHGPAWTRKKNKRKDNLQHDVYSGGGGIGSSSSSLSLHDYSTPAALVHVPREAPYLTHTIRNPLGQVTLVPPDNLGRARLAHSPDPTTTATDSSSAQTTTTTKVKKSKKPKKIQAATEADPEILNAVLNVGRRPSPVNHGASGTGAGHVLGTDATNGHTQDSGTRIRTTRATGLGSATTVAPMQRSASAQSNAERRSARARAAQARVDEAAIASARTARTDEDRSSRSTWRDFREM
jgi:hypothetical protein